MELWVLPAAVSGASAMALAMLCGRRWWRHRAALKAQGRALDNLVADRLDGLRALVDCAQERLARTEGHLKGLATALQKPADPLAQLAERCGLVDWVVRPLYDTAEICRSGPNITYRMFTDTRGKSDRDVSGDIGGGGQLYAPRCFVVTGLQCRLNPKRAPYHGGEELEDAKIAQDRAALASALHVRLRIGVRDYFTAPFRLLRDGEARFDRRPLVIPPQQAFYVDATVIGCAPLSYDWELTIGLDGILGQQNEQWLDERRRRGEPVYDRRPGGYGDWGA